MVGLDGRAGSGKTTLGNQLAATARGRGVDTALVHLDDTYDGWEGLPGLAPRLLADLFTPLAEGAPGRTQRYDWVAGRFDGWIDVPGPELLIVEGVGAGHRAFDAFRSLLVWVECPPELCLTRGIARDGIDMLPQWEAWRGAEAAYFTEQDLPGRADIVVLGHEPR